MLEALHVGVEQLGQVVQLRVQALCRRLGCHMAYARVEACGLVLDLAQDFAADSLDSRQQLLAERLLPLGFRTLQSFSGTGDLGRDLLRAPPQRGDHEVCGRQSKGEDSNYSPESDDHDTIIAIASRTQSAGPSAAG